MVQVENLHESKDLVAAFKNLNSSIDNACDTITDSIIKCFGADGEGTRFIAKDKLPRSFAPGSLLDSETPVDVLVFTLLRFHVSQELYSSLTRFHPASHLVDFNHCYQSIRRAG